MNSQNQTTNQLKDQYSVESVVRWYQCKRINLWIQSNHSSYNLRLELTIIQQESINTE